MRRIISALILGFSATLPLAHAATATKATKPLQVAPDAPERYVVVKGDTLWSISSRFLRDPARWPELWRMNKGEIKNPHWIYPGQIVHLVRDPSGAYLRVETVKLQPQERSEPIKEAIWSISAEAIEPWLTRPLVTDGASLDGAARVVAVQDSRTVAGTNDRIYVTNVGTPTRNWHVFRPGIDLIDPETKEFLGQEALYLGTARQLSEGDPAEFVIQSSKLEIRLGDRLIPAPPAEIVNYLPHPPELPITGSVVSLAGGVGHAGRSMIVALNRGRVDGVDMGTVFALDLAGGTVDDRFNGAKTTLQIPDRTNGWAFVFRVYDRVSYALLMEAVRPVKVGDKIRNP